MLSVRNNRPTRPLAALIVPALLLAAPVPAVELAEFQENTDLQRQLDDNVPAVVDKRRQARQTPNVETDTETAEETTGSRWRQKLETNIAIGLEYDDNVDAVADEFKRSDQILTVAPKITSLWRYGRQEFELGYEGDYGRYADDSDLNYDDHDLHATAEFKHSRRLNAEYELGYGLSRDAPGSTDELSDVDGEVDTSTNTSAGAAFTFGRPGRRNALVAALGYDAKRYDGAEEAFRDYDQFDVTGTLFHRVAPKTRLLLEAGLTDYDYPNDAERSGQESTFLGGVTWRATGKTTGIFKIGYLDRKNESGSDFEDISTLTFFLEAIWDASASTEISVSGERGTEESARQDVGAFVDNTVSLGIQHAMSRRFSLFSDLTYGLAEFEDNREDTRRDITVGAFYRLKRWLALEASYSFEERDSTDDDFDYNANIFRIIARTTFRPR